VSSGKTNFEVPRPDGQRRERFILADFSCTALQRQLAIGNEEPGFLLGIGGGCQSGVVAGGMQAKDHLGLGGFLGCRRARAGRRQPKWPCACSTHNPTTDSGALAAGRSVFLCGPGPKTIRGLAQFPMDFLRVVMRPQVINLWIGTSISVIFLAGTAGGRRPCQNLCSRSTLPLAWGVGAKTKPISENLSPSPVGSERPDRW
jgi:hypothetical protein